MTSIATLLLVDDSSADREATVRALRRAGFTGAIEECEDGDQALDYLKRSGSADPGARPPRPSLVLLDLNLPGTDGREVLAQAKADPDLLAIPFIVFSTSSDPCDIERCYRAGASSYVQKPIGVEAFVRALASLKAFYLDVALLPEIDGDRDG